MSKITIERYQKLEPSLESYWRSIILFGRNSASYKFALGKSLLELSQKNKTEVDLKDLSEPFSRHICEHLKIAPVQGTSKSSKFLKSCKKYNEGKISKEELLDITYKYAFENVIDAFHIVNRENTDIKFYEKNYSKGKKIILRDELFQLNESDLINTLYSEVESRWRLVETAWELGVNPNLLVVNYDMKDKDLFIIDENLKRKDITSIRDSLNGYQKGKCFYCNGNYSIEVNDPNICEVDHFYPHILKPYLHEYINIDGVWNLVLACQNCNRSKLDKIPDIEYLKKLYNRNEYLILSHNPLRETLMNQTGKTTKKRYKFFNSVDNYVQSILPNKNRWKTKNKAIKII